MLDKTLNDIMKDSKSANFEMPFGEKVVVLGGNFRQILSVVPKGSRQDIVNASINSSYLWNHCKVLKLTKNMRLLNCKYSQDVEELREFSKWVASIGDGTIGPINDRVVDIKIPKDILLHGGLNPIHIIVKVTYPNFNGTSRDTSFLEGRAILEPTLDMVDEINEHMISLNTLEGRQYLSSDSTCKGDSGLDNLQSMYTPEYLNSLKSSGFSNHKLNLKIGTPMMLLRNIDHSLGLCNGTRMIITRLCDHVIEASLITGNNAGKMVLLLRMTLTPSDPRMPFKFQKRRFPLIVSYAMTTNKNQGQSLSNVGLCLKKLVFSHGQLYVIVSRVTNRSSLKILIYDKDGQPCSVTTNVVYKEIFQNLC